MAATARNAARNQTGLLRNLIVQNRLAFSTHILPDRAHGYATNASTIPGDGAEGAGKTSGMSGSDACGEEMRVNKKVRDELQEPEGVKVKAKQALHAVGDKVKGTGKAIKDTTDNETVEKVGDTVEGAGKTLKENSSDKQGLGTQDVVTS